MDKVQKQFLDRLVPFAFIMSKQTWGKSITYKKILSKTGIYPSLILSDILLRSNWGTHPVSQIKLGKHDANNLSLLEATNDWKEKIEYEGKLYRAYDSWREYIVDWTDWIVFNSSTGRLLSAPTLEEQIKEMGDLRPLVEYNERILELIYSNDLRKYDDAAQKRSF